ncbi:nickel pincer cofactor biosynthesis protein LarC [Thermoguttaceae bacterium LCP21S3_D4]
MKKRSLYLDCHTGISGDMVVAALLDAGADREVLETVLKSIPISGFEIAISNVQKAVLSACDFRVILDAAHENHDHDMKYLFGQEEAHTHGEHSHSEETHTHGEHSYSEETHTHGEHSYSEESHTHEEHHHEHRGLLEIYSIIDGTKMTETARALAKKIFRILAEAEAKAHGVPVEEVHFHEVGAVDSIVDIIAAAVCVDHLNVDEVIIPALWEGEGTVRCQHGILPIPVPAVTNIVMEYGISMGKIGELGEYVTPTGAAIAAAICTSRELPECYRIVGSGLGAGKRDYKRPGLLRALLLETEEAVYERDAILKLECNIDDCTGEALGYAMELLLENGARDVHYIPVYMKKNRPAYQLTVICKKEDREKLEAIIFRETTTIGIRYVEMERTILPRRTEKRQTSYGEVAVKISEGEGEVCITPEYESIREICREQGLSFQKVYYDVLRELK